MVKIASNIPPSAEDFELLRLAAEAVGMTIYPDGKWLLEVGNPRRPWNPLADDGDALRLAARAGISFDVNGLIISVGFAGLGNYIYCGNVGDDDLSNLRLQIVKAVVEKQKRITQQRNTGTIT